MNTDPVQARGLPTIHHDLEVTLSPDTHEIIVRDVLTIPSTLIESKTVSFQINPHLTIRSLDIDGMPIPLSTMMIEPLATSTSPNETPVPTRQRITIPIAPQEPLFKFLKVTIAYQGHINDPPQASGDLRFVRPDETNGHIGPEGIYLSSETFWYPVWESVLHTYKLNLTLPEGWEAVTQGKPLARIQGSGTHTTTWYIQTPSQALTVSANRFKVEIRQWQDIQIATYLFHEEAALAPQYLDATIQYLKVYTGLLGRYPFSTFAVAENFFPSGLGMPAFTLLGQGVMRRGYTQPYSLGHEIVHSWFGNSVFNDFTQGNWVEGLTTYLSNYYYDEVTGKTHDAFNTRRRMHHEYNVYTSPQDDYPIHEFHHKETRRDNAVGYQKTALVFHMLRQEIGDQAFFNGVRQIIQEGTGRYIEWPDLEKIFSRVSAQDLGWFFKQWVNRAGAPDLDWKNVAVREDQQKPGQFSITGNITQHDPSYRVTLPLQVELEGGDTHFTNLPLSGNFSPLDLQVPARPTKLRIDPDHHILRRLGRDQLPPMLNLWETDSSRTVILPHAPTTAEEEAYASLMQRLKHQLHITIVSTNHPDYTQPGSYLTIGAIARQTLEDRSRNLCQDVVHVSSRKVTILNQPYESPDMAFLLSCPHPDHPGHTMTFFFGLSPEAMMPVSRLLFFYGWDSYLVFQQGHVVARGLLDPVHSAQEIMLPSP
ncbi:MAG: M1 family metallopeptidase [Nitrospirales bacterium]